MKSCLQNEDMRGTGKIDFRRLISEAEKRNDVKGVRDVVVLHLVREVGLKRGEISGLDMEDFDVENRTLRVKKQFLTLPETTTVVFKAWIRIRGTGRGPMFTNFDRARKGDGRLTGTGIYQIIRRLGKETGIHSGPEQLRHVAIRTFRKEWPGPWKPIKEFGEKLF